MFKTVLEDVAQATQDALDHAMGGYADLPVIAGMRYASNGGKRLRAFLVMESARLFDVPDAVSVQAAAAIEALHAYSLVHDDLPCMDNDDLRRGLPTVHVKWDDATAVLVGDALQTLAFDLIAGMDTDAEVRIALVASLAKASGAQGMVLGQAQDIAAETAPVPLNLDQIMELQSNKTGALIRWSAEAGALMGQADVAPLRRYAQALGLAFQITDDILDLEGDATTAGKRLQKDAEAGKATFVSLLGLEAAKAQARALVEEADAALTPFGSRAKNLREAARFVIARNK